MAVEDGIAILSCDPGRDTWNTVMGTLPQNSDELSKIPSGQLFLYRYRAPELSDADALVPIELLGLPEVGKFHPLGIEYHRESRTLLVCNHHIDGSRVEIFSLDIDSFRPVARHVRTIHSPLIKSPNAITVLNEHEFYVTSDHYFLARENPWLAKLETLGGIPGGSLVHVNLSTGDNATPQIRTVAHIPFANGVALLNSSALAVASTSTSSILLFDIQPDRSVQATETGVIRVPFMPDNLSTDKEGTLVIAGHPHPPSLDHLREDRLRCIKRQSGDMENCHNRTAPSWVAEWTADKGFRSIYVTKGGFGTSTTAMKDTDSRVGIVTGLYSNGIAVWRYD